MTKNGATRRVLDEALANTFPCSEPVAIGHCENPGVPSHDSHATAAVDALRKPSVKLSKKAARLGIEVWELELLAIVHRGNDKEIAAAAAHLRMRLT